MLNKLNWLSLVIFLFLLAGAAACDDGAQDEDADAGGITDSGEDAAGDSDTDSDADAGQDSGDDEWVNPGCNADRNVIRENLRVVLTVDLTKEADDVVSMKEEITVTAPEAGDAVTFFGEKFTMGRASAGYAYDNHEATFCVEPFNAGDDVTVEVEYDVILKNATGMQMWGLKRWSQGTMSVIGPMNEPYFAPYWLMAPQSSFTVDPVYDDSPAIESIDLTVTVPDEAWTVVGPGGPAAVDGNDWNFVFDVPQPLYALSFVASTDFEEPFSVGKTKSGVDVIAAVSSARRSAVEQVFPDAVVTIDWMEQNIGPFEFGDYLTLVEIPVYGGGMEHTTVTWIGSSTIEVNEGGSFIVVHEVVHHWWGDNVRFADWPHFWLAEGFDEWSTNFNIMGEILSPGQFDARKLRYRTNAAEYSYPRFNGMPDPGPLRFDDGDDVLMDHWAFDLNLYYVYGAAFLEMVNQRLMKDFGTDLIEALAAWFDLKHLSSTTTEEFLEFLEETTEDDAGYWSDLFDDWVYQTPCPTLEIADYDYSEGEASVSITRTAGGDQDISDLEIVFMDGTDEYSTTVELPGAQDSDVATVTMPSEPTMIAVDPDLFYILRLETGSGWTGPSIGFTTE